MNNIKACTDKKKKFFSVKKNEFFLLKTQNKLHLILKFPLKIYNDFNRIFVCWYLKLLDF